MTDEIHPGPVNIKDYIINENYTSIFFYNGFINIQADYNIFNSALLDSLFNDKIDHPTYFKDKSLKDKEEEVYSETVKIAKGFSRENVIWENLPVDTTKVNYALEFILSHTEKIYITKENLSTDHPLHFVYK